MVAMHAQRRLLNDEVHARPNQPVPTPARLIHLVLLHQGDVDAQRRTLADWLQAWQCRPAPADCDHHVATSGDRSLRWALHTEFVRYTVMQTQAAERFDDDGWQLLPTGLLAALPGELLVAAQVLVLADDGSSIPVLARRQQWFQEEDWVGAELAGGRAVAVTDLRLYPVTGLPGGASRIVLQNRSMSPGQTGRMLQRLVEIETYRMLALLALPIAKQQLREIDRIRTALQPLTGQLLHGEDDGAALQWLSQLAAEAEGLSATSQYRFSAARAYHALVARRIEELREQRLEGVQPFGEFLQRRLQPALATCETAGQRQERLQARLQRAMLLLRTRIDVNREAQNQRLLSSMDRRAALQLRLQQTVEGLSVAVLTYYITGLIGYLLKAGRAAGLPLPVELLTGLALPLVLIAVVFASRRLRRQLEREAG